MYQPLRISLCMISLNLVEYKEMEVLFGGFCTQCMIEKPILKPWQRLVVTVWKCSNRLALLSAATHTPGLYGVCRWSFLCVRACASSIGECTISRTRVHVVMFFLTPFISLSLAAYKLPTITEPEHFVNSFTEGIELVIPDTFDCAVDDWCIVLLTSKADCADQ